MSETDSETTYQFARNEPDDADGVNLATDPKLALLAVCIASQQKAGFGLYLDLRQAQCPHCAAPGFNTGWGFWRFVCGAEIGPEGDEFEPCATAEPERLPA